MSALDQGEEPGSPGVQPGDGYVVGRSLNEFHRSVKFMGPQSPVIGSRAASPPRPRQHPAAPHARRGRCYPARKRCSILAAGPPAWTLRVPDGSVCEPAMLFHRPIVSTIILISGQGAVDLVLHLIDLGIQEFLHSLEFGN